MDREVTPIVSRVLPDGTLLEALYDPVHGATALAIGHPDGTSETAPFFRLPDGSRLVPYSPTNNLLTTGCVLLPSAVEEIGNIGDIVDDIRTYLARYVDFSAGFLQLAPYYVLLSWVSDAFSEVPYLRLQGGHGCGKTRGLLALGSVCNRPFFASGASTVSPLFHVLDACSPTLLLDEADFRYSDMTSELTKILNNGTVRGLPVLRTMTNRHKELNPTAFKVFGPKLVAMREGFSDQALESRFLTERMPRRQLSSHIPINTPDRMRQEAQLLRNRLLAWRLSTFHSVAPDPAARLLAADARTNQMALPLLSLVADLKERAEIATWIMGQRAGEHLSAETLVIEAMADAFSVVRSSYVAIADIAQRVNAKLAVTNSAMVTNKWIGGVVRSLGIPTYKSNGTYGIQSIERARILALAERQGVQRIPTQPEPPTDGAAAV